MHFIECKLLLETKPQFFRDINEATGGMRWIYHFRHRARKSMTTKGNVDTPRNYQHIAELVFLTYRNFPLCHRNNIADDILRKIHTYLYLKATFFIVYNAVVNRLKALEKANSVIYNMLISIAKCRSSCYLLNRCMVLNVINLIHIHKVQITSSSINVSKSQMAANHHQLLFMLHYQPFGNNFCHKCANWDSY